VPEDLAIFHGSGGEPGDYLLAGGSAIIGPDGHCLAGPAGPDETILVADLDLARIPAEHLTFDAVGHYGRPDVFTLSVNTTPQTHLEREG
jgi:nitrilase